MKILMATFLTGSVILNHMTKLPETKCKCVTPVELRNYKDIRDIEKFMEKQPAPKLNTNPELKLS